MKTTLYWIAGILAALLLVWLLAANNLAMRAVFAPLNESVRRDVFEQSKAFQSGAIQELMSLRVQYQKEDDETVKKALASLIKHKAADVPVDAFPGDLYVFVKSL